MFQIYQVELMFYKSTKFDLRDAMDYRAKDICSWGIFSAEVYPHSSIAIQRTVRMSWISCPLNDIQAGQVQNPGAQPGEAFGAFAPPEIFKTLHSNSDIYRNFQIIKLKFCILIIFKKSLTWNFLYLTYLLTRYILRQIIWSKISYMIGI